MCLYGTCTMYMEQIHTHTYMYNIGDKMHPSIHPWSDGPGAFAVSSDFPAVHAHVQGLRSEQGVYHQNEVIFQGI